MKCTDHDSRSLVAALVQNCCTCSCQVRVDCWQGGPSLLRFFLVKFQLYLSCRHKPWSQRSWKQRGHFPFSSLSKLAHFFFCLLHCTFCSTRHSKSIEGVLPSDGVRKFSNVSQHFLMPGLSWTGQTSLSGVAPVPWDWEDATCLDLVVSFLISMLRWGLCTSTPHPHTSTWPYTLYARIHIVKERRLAWPQGENWKGSEESRVFVALFGQI